MNTRLLDDPVLAAEVIREGGLVAFPTETVYGLGADVWSGKAIQRVFEAKGRPPDNPLIAHIHDRSQVVELAGPPSDVAVRLMDAFFPGPITLVLPRRTEVPDIVTAGLDSIGVRMPDHPVAREFLQACGRPVAAPSANRSGRPSPTSWEAVEEDLGGRIDAILKGDNSRVGLESTVVDCLGSAPVVLRAGSISLEDLCRVVPATRMGAADSPRSPGTRHRHYRPNAEVRLVNDPIEAAPGPGNAYIGLDSPPGDLFQETCLVGDVSDYARQMFAFFRFCEQQGVHTIWCQRVPLVGIGRAVMDRLERAAS